MSFLMHRPIIPAFTIAIGTTLLLLLLTFGRVGAAGGGTVVLKGRIFEVEIARSVQEKATGLMFRDALPSNEGMFFLYDEDEMHAIWMKNCKVPLDVIWVDGAGKIVEIAEKVPPCPLAAANCPQYGGKVVSRHFIELAAGTVARVGIRVGDPLGWNLSVPREGVWIYTPGVTVKPIFQKK
jgi:uncharacterized membrane protein (UPF0127 family)